jgi:hypothetical protein
MSQEHPPKIGRMGEMGIFSMIVTATEPGDDSNVTLRLYRSKRLIRA